MSVYFNGLVGEVRNRYLQKLSLINNVDPYDCDTREFSADVFSFPNIVIVDITNYLISTTSFYSFDEFRAYKSLTAYKLFKSGWVRDIICKKFGENILVLAKVLHSQKLNETYLEPWIITRSNGEILSAHCTCVAGLGEVCSHVAAVLFAVQEERASLPEKSVTDVKSVWNVAREPVNEILEWAKIPGHRILKTSVKVPELNDDEVLQYLTQWKSFGTISPALKTTSPLCTELTDEDLNPGFTNPLNSMYCEINNSLTLDELRNIGLSFSLSSLSMTPGDCARVEKSTRGQSDNKLWHQQRTGRITASNFKKACSTTIDKPAVSTIKAICYSKKFFSKSTQYGCKHEKDALATYLNHNCSSHTYFAAAQVGLILSPEYPHFGASPDAIVSYECCGDGCVEVKCPYCLKDCEFADKLPPYLEKDGDVISLKRNHAYFHQMQMQMAICNKDYCDFVVWTKRETLITRIEFDEEFWIVESTKATEFWRLVILPELFGKFYTRQSQETRPDVENVASSSTSTVVAPDTPLWCVCRMRDDGRKMIQCDNKACPTQKFHTSCLMMKNRRKSWYCSACEASHKPTKRNKH